MNTQELKFTPVATEVTPQGEVIESVPRETENISVDDAERDWALTQRKCKAYVESGYLPKGMTIAQAITIASLSRALGIEPIIGLKNIYVINGKPEMHAAFMKALVHQKLPHCVFNLLESTDKKCTFQVARTKEAPLAEYSFTWEDAERANLTKNPAWSKFPRAMLRSRCISEICRSEFPDVFLGAVYAEGELSE
jgi:hypothetical protein